MMQAVHPNKKSTAALVACLTPSLIVCGIGTLLLTSSDTKTSPGVYLNTEQENLPNLPGLIALLLPILLILPVLGIALLCV